MAHVLAGIFLLAGIVISISRLGKNLTSRASGSFLIRKIEKNQAYAEKISNNYTSFYNKLPIVENKDFFSQVIAFPENLKLKKYTILKVFMVDQNKILCIAKCVDDDFSIKMSGRMGNVRKVYSYNFVIKQNVAKSQYEFYSDMYDDLNEKNLKMDFRDELTKFLQKTNK